MGASLIDLQMKHPNNSFLNYINETAEHLNYGEPRLADGDVYKRQNCAPLGVTMSSIRFQI